MYSKNTVGDTKKIPTDLDSVQKNTIKTKHQIACDTVLSY